MKILKSYQWNIAWYSLVELDDGSRVELKFRQKSEPTEGAIFQAADDFQKAIAAAKLAEQEAEKAAQEKARRISDKETGAEIGKLTLGNFSKLLADKLKAKPAAGTILMTDLLGVGE